MKTQVITLASHDNLISVRDRMAWAKTPRILLVWPRYERVALRAIDLRILQKHATKLGAHLGLVTRHSHVRRDAKACGIAVFSSTKDAQRLPWFGYPAAGGRRQRSPGRLERLRDIRGRARGTGPDGNLHVVSRVFILSVGVMAAVSMALLFVPRASIELSPISRPQIETIPVQTVDEERAQVQLGMVPVHRLRLNVEGLKAMPVDTRMPLPQVVATGEVEFRNLTEDAVVIPAGTVVYSLEPGAVRFVTLDACRIDRGANTGSTATVEALEAGVAGNLPANAIQGIEGPLSALVSVTNPAPMTGGLDVMEYVPSLADREQLRSSLLQQLELEAREQLAEQIDETDILVSDRLQLLAIEDQVFHPLLGRPGSVLELEMGAAFEAVYVAGADLREVARLALDSTMPADFRAEGETLVARLEPIEGRTRFDLQAERTIVRKIDLALARSLVRGRTSKEASRYLESKLPLAKPPTVSLWPPWWPQLPLLPFRIAVVLG